MPTLHLSAVVITFLVVLYADEQGLQWFRGRVRTLASRKVAVLHVLVSIGIALILLTGALMFIDRAEYLLSQTVFLVKMCFVGALIINGFFIGSLSRLASEKAFAELTPAECTKVLISGSVSLVGWLGAITCGLILARF
jgi:cation transport ATPase